MATSTANLSKDVQNLIVQFLAFVSGGRPLGAYTKDQWNMMITWAGAEAGLDPKKVKAGDYQPLQIFDLAFQKFDGGAFNVPYQKAKEAGMAANFWIKDANAPTGYTYNNAMGGTVGSGAPAGTPGAVPGAGGGAAGAGGTTDLPPDVLNALNAVVAANPAGSTSAETAAQHHQTVMNRQASYQSIATGLGLGWDSNLQSLAAQAAQHGWNGARFQNALYQTTEFQQQFPGIFNAQGGLKMSPTQYLRNKAAYQTAAGRAGIDLSPNRLTYLFQNNVSPSEFGQRAQAITTLRTNADYFKAFNQQLKAQGMPELSKGDQMNFVLGQGNQAWYDEWNKATTRYAARESGMPGIGNKIVNEVSGKGLSEAAQQQDFAKLATQIRTTLPLSRVSKMGLSKQDLVQLEFGGPRQAAVAQKVQQILANRDAFDKDQTTSVTPGAFGQRGSQPRAQV